MFFIDIAVPRDIDPDVNGLDNVYLYDIDDLKEVVEENLAQRREEAARAEAIVDSETRAFGHWLKSLDLQPTIVDLLRTGEEIADRELAKTLKRLGNVDDETREALQTMVRAAARKIFHEPICFLKRRAREEASTRRYIDVTRRMFNLDGDEVPPDAHAARRGIGAEDAEGAGSDGACGPGEELDMDLDGGLDGDLAGGGDLDPGAEPKNSGGPFCTGGRAEDAK
jgi:glutamyl-tRNA reductase